MDAFMPCSRASALASQLQRGISIVNGIAVRVLTIASSFSVYCAMHGMQLSRKIGRY